MVKTQISRLKKVYSANNKEIPIQKQKSSCKNNDVTRGDEIQKE